jgi:hypothetical protein
MSILAGLVHDRERCPGVPHAASEIKCQIEHAAAPIKETMVPIDHENAEIALPKTLCMSVWWWGSIRLRFVADECTYPITVEASMVG